MEPAAVADGTRHPAASVKHRGTLILPPPLVRLSEQLQKFSANEFLVVHLFIVLYLCFVIRYILSMIFYFYIFLQNK
jgi:hypothetical protein